MSSINSFDSQYEIFKPQDDDSKLVKANKKRMTDIMKIFEKNGILTTKRVDDYEMINSFPNKNSDCTFLRGKDNKQALQEQGDIEIQFLQIQELNLEKKLSFFKELEILTTISCDNQNPNIFRLKNVFFEKFHENMTMNLVFSTIFFGKKDQEIQFHSFGDWVFEKNAFESFGSKREPEDVRTVLIEILKQLSFLHSKKIILLNLINFDNIIIMHQDDVNGNFVSYKIIIAGLGQDADFYKIFSNAKKSQDEIAGGINRKRNYEFAPEMVSYKTERSIIETADDVNQLTMEKWDFFTPKVDIYSLGIMISKIFFSENVNDSNLLSEDLDEADDDESSQMDPDAPIIPKKFPENVTKGIIDARINSLFEYRAEYQMATEEALEELVRIIQTCCKSNCNDRPASYELLASFKIFDGINVRFFMRDLEDMFRIALHYDEGDEGYDRYKNAIVHYEKSYFKARKILERLSLKHHFPATYCWGVYVSQV